LHQLVRPQEPTFMYSSGKSFAMRLKSSQQLSISSEPEFKLATSNDKQDAADQA